METQSFKPFTRHQNRRSFSMPSSVLCVLRTTKRFTLKNRLTSGTEAGKCYASLLCDDGIEAPTKPTRVSNVIGLDMGLAYFAIKSDARAYWNYRWRDSSFPPMEAYVKPSQRWLRPRTWEVSPDRSGSSHKNSFKLIKSPDGLFMINRMILTKAG